MRKGETPTLTMTFDKEIDFGTVASIVATFATDYHKVIFEKTMDEMAIEGSTIHLSFTQEETLSFPSVMLVQVNFLCYDGTRFATDIQKLRFDENLKDEVMA